MELKQLQNLFEGINRLIISVKLRYFQYRLLIKALYTNVRVSKWLDISSNCTFCHKKPETILHLFVECHHVQKIWQALKKWLNNFHKIKVVWTPSVIIFSNYKGKSAKLVNTLLLIFKFYIYKTKVQVKNKLKFIDGMSDVVHFKNIEKRIAVKDDK